MSGLDIEGVLREHWPIPVFGCECTPTDDESGEKAVLETSWEVHVAHLLREQIAAAQAEVLRPIHSLVTGWEDGNEKYGATERERNRTHILRVLVDEAAAQLAPARVPSEEG